MGGTLVLYWPIDPQSPKMKFREENGENVWGLIWWNLEPFFWKAQSGINPQSHETQKFATRDCGRRGWNFRLLCFFWKFQSQNFVLQLAEVRWIIVATERCPNGKGTCTWTCTNHLFLRVSIFSSYKELKHDIHRFVLERETFAETQDP